MPDVDDAPRHASELLDSELLRRLSVQMFQMREPDRISRVGEKLETPENPVASLPSSSPKQKQFVGQT